MIGYVVLIGYILNILDVYNFFKDIFYKFDESFDEKIGYCICLVLILLV